MSDKAIDHFRVIKAWAMGSSRECNSCGETINFWDLYEKFWKVKLVKNEKYRGKPTIGVCGTEGCQTVWFSCPFCGDSI